MTTSNPRRPSWLRSLQSFQSSVQQAGPAAVAGYSLIGAIGFCGGVGYVADWWLGSAPTGLTSGLLIGVVVGLYLLAREVWRR